MKNQIVELNNGIKVCVIEELEHLERKFVFCALVSDDGHIEDKFMICEIKLIDGELKLEDIKEPNLMKDVAEIFGKILHKA